MIASADFVMKHHARQVGSGRRERTVTDLNAARVCRACNGRLYEFYEEGALLAAQQHPWLQWRNFTLVGWEQFGLAMIEMISPHNQVLAWLPKESNSLPARWVRGTVSRSRRAIIIADTGANGDRLIPMLAADYNLTATPADVVALDRVPAEME